MCEYVTAKTIERGSKEKSQHIIYANEHFLALLECSFPQRCAIWDGVSQQNIVRKKALQQRLLHSHTQNVLKQIPSACTPPLPQLLWFLIIPKEHKATLLMLPQLSQVFHQHNSIFFLITFLLFAYLFFLFYYKLYQMLLIVSLAAPTLLFLPFLKSLKSWQCVSLAAVVCCTISIVQF